MSYAGVIFDTASGAVLGTRSGAGDPPALGAGLGFLTADLARDWAGAKVVNGALVAGAPVLADLQAAAWATAKAYREQRMSAGCASPKGRVQTDAASQRKVDSAARQALFWSVQKQLDLVSVAKVTIGATWSIDWTMADNSVVTHDASAMLALADAVTSYVTACQIASRAVRAKIFAASTPAALAAIDITAGYPA